MDCFDLYVRYSGIVCRAYISCDYTVSRPLGRYSLITCIELSIVSMSDSNTGSPSQATGAVPQVENQQLEIKEAIALLLLIYTLAIRRKKQKAVLMYKCLNGLVPNYLQNLFTHRCTSYNLRNQEYKITLPKPRTDFLKRSFSYSGAKLWNDLPLSIRSSSSLAKFKREINLIF